MQINRIIQNSCKYGMRVAVLRVYVRKYFLTIVMPVEHSYTQVTGLKDLGDSPRLTVSMKRAKQNYMDRGACQRPPNVTKATKRKGKSNIAID